MPIDTKHMTELARMIKQLCGLALDDSKAYLVESRLSQLAKENGGDDDYVQLCRKAIAGDRVLRTKVIDAMTTHETLFFRDDSPFSVLKNKVLPDLLDSKAGMALSRRIRVWSAACSTGQEPYSVAMTFHELLPDIASWDINILATDIADQSVTQTSAGKYSDYEIGRGMKQQLLNKYFTRIAGGWKVKDPLRALIRCRQLNLLDRFDHIGPFDIIFCRNVAIYFDPAARRSLFQRLAKRLTPNGYLFVGSSESLTNIGPNFRPQLYCRSVFYQPNKSADMALA